MRPRETSHRRASTARLAVLLLHASGLSELRELELGQAQVSISHDYSIGKPLMGI